MALPMVDMWIANPGKKIQIRDAITANSKYYIIGINGSKAKRLKHGMIVSIVPFAYTEQDGLNTIYVSENRNTKMENAIEIKANLEFGKSYTVTNELDIIERE